MLWIPEATGKLVAIYADGHAEAIEPPKEEQQEEKQAYGYGSYL